MFPLECSYAFLIFPMRSTCPTRISLLSSVHSNPAFPYMTVCKPGLCAELVYACSLLQELSQGHRNFKTPRLLISINYKAPCYTVFTIVVLPSTSPSRKIPYTHMEMLSILGISKLSAMNSPSTDSKMCEVTGLGVSQQWLQFTFGSSTKFSTL